MNAVQAFERPVRALRTAPPLLGPAFVAAIAYVDPGNFATNFAAGSQYGYLLLWVIVAANGMAMLIQALSAKLGLATGRNLPEVCRDTFPRPVTVGLWAQAEIVAIAMEEGFDDLDAPVLRVCNEDVPLPYAANLEKLALVSADKVVTAVKKVCYRT